MSRKYRTWFLEVIQNSVCIVSSVFLSNRAHAIHLNKGTKDNQCSEAAKHASNVNRWTGQDSGLFLTQSFQAFFDDIIFFISHITEHINALGTEDRSPKFQFHCYWKGIIFPEKKTWKHVFLNKCHEIRHLAISGCLWKLIEDCFSLDCGMSFKNKANLRIHIRHHSGDKATACPYCGVFFSNNSKLFDHILRRASSS